ncbi:hypothetical protein [Vitiosangium sp. GDMCC 1.1324]|uniref:hypothetical protein n=1 Tax=Vitiosangium sp. (strain GDMCC 1.1324) TaxID=2138576 RepID=UPI000D3D16D1|nr:hypothetical protein [Vitiosangium sp. GDMCC 1.1324]PTL80219.1 hypothetical protein DAT35_29925 [Vitiosangium sp. GDMCC 1.1324]
MSGVEAPGCLGLLAIPACLFLLLLSASTAANTAQAREQQKYERMEKLRSQVFGKNQVSLSRELACAHLELELLANFAKPTAMTSPASSAASPRPSSSLD